MISILKITLAAVEKRLEDLLARSVRLWVVVQQMGEGTFWERGVNEFKGSQDVKLRGIDGG